MKLTRAFPLLSNCWRNTIHFVQWWLFTLSDQKLCMPCFFSSLSSFSVTLVVKLTTFWASFCCHSEKHICLVVNLLLAFTSQLLSNNDFEELTIGPIPSMLAGLIPSLHLSSPGACYKVLQAFQVETRLLYLILAKS